MGKYLSIVEKVEASQSAQPAPIDDLQPAGKPSRFDLIINRRAPSPIAPIDAAPGVKIVDIEKFVSATLATLACYVAAKNQGRSAIWIENLVDEKIERLRLCGVEAEIRTNQ